MNYVLSPLQHFRPAEIRVLETATDFDSLRDVALAQAERMYRAVGGGDRLKSSPVSITCGAISNNQTGTKAENMVHFTKAVEHFIDVTDGRHFSQLPYEPAVWRIMDQLKADGVDFSDPDTNPVLQGFYRPLFASGFLGIQRFLYNTQYSIGALWEQRFGRQHGLRQLHYDHKLQLVD